MSAISNPRFRVRASPHSQKCIASLCEERLSRDEAYRFVIEGALIGKSNRYLVDRISLLALRASKEKYYCSVRFKSTVVV